MTVLAEEIQKSRPDLVDAAHVHPIGKMPGQGARKPPPFAGGTLLDDARHSVQKLCNGIMDLLQHAKAFDSAGRRVDSAGIVVFSSYLFKTVTSGEIGHRRRRRRSNRPGNSQAKGPRDEDSIWKEAPRAFDLTVSADGIILSGTATDGASMVRSGDGS